MPGSNSATLCVGSLDFATGEFQYCTAGHPPPLLVTADARARYAEPSGAGPLGSGAGFPVRTEVLDVGDSVLLYTDGLIERPGRPLGASTAEFAELAANIAGGNRGFAMDAPGGPSTASARRHLSCCSGRPATTTTSLCLRRNGAHRRRRCA